LTERTSERTLGHHRTLEFPDLVVEKLGGLDILVNNVGAGAVRDFDDLTEDDWRRTLDLNFLSYVNASRASLPALRDAEAPCIVNNASDLGRQPEARAEGPKIRVNAVAPGPIWSPFWTKPGGFADTLAKVHGMEPEAAVEHKMKLRQLPLQRLGKPEEVASVITFLASDACSYVTGSVWGVDGGSIRSLI
jgi:NAD(P)-dependent dehydrogenase (short-subunit alcohol dehydrogenase family)